MTGMSASEKRTPRSTIADLCLPASPPMAAASDEEKLVGTYAEARTILAFKVSDAALQTIVPKGWQVSPIATGAAKDANLTVLLVDALVAQTPDGASEPLFRIAALSILAKRPGLEAPIAMIAGGFESVQKYVPGAYGFSLGRTTVERNLRADPDGTSSAQESWQFRGDNGNSIELELHYVRGLAMHGTMDTRVYSAMNPDFYRIYRIEQAEDVVRSVSTGTDRVRKFAFKASGPQFAQLFDGSERLISITSLPWYTRQVSLPAGAENAIMRSVAGGI
jgi:hypothetical protein